METSNEYKLVPGFGNSFGTGWRVMMDNFLRLFLVVIILAIVATPLKMFNFHSDWSDLHRGPWNLGNNWGHDLFSLGTFGIFAAFFGLLAMLYTFLVKPIIEYGGSMIFVQAVRKTKPDF